jgi:NTE family protein
MTTDDPFVERVKQLLAVSNAFPGADEEYLESVARAASWLSLRGGETLFAQGESSDAIYIIINGLLAAQVRDHVGQITTVARIGAGEVIGDMGAVAEEPRSATVRALRSSELVALSRDALEPLARKHPMLLKWLYRTVAKRLRAAQEGRRTTYQPRTFCLLPNVDPDSATAFAHRLASEFSAFGSTFLVTKERLGDATSDQLAASEAAHEYVVYLADSSHTSWSRLCLSQADKILIAVNGKDAPRRIEPLDECVSPEIPVELVLLWSGSITLGRTALWLDLVHANGHLHVLSPSDVSRAARLLTGRGVGLVLSGGGARGLAHLGVARALVRHGVQIDVICGTSIGAFIGAALALGVPVATVRDRVHEFSRKHPLRELVIPGSSLLSGRGLRGVLEKSFGDCGIEDTPIRYACVTSNLTTSSFASHGRGKLKVWVGASCAMPGIFPPVFAGEALHVDGGVLNNFPTDIIRGMGAGLVVGVDVGLRPAENADMELPNIFELLMRAATMSDAARGLTIGEQCDILLVPNVQHLGLMSWRAYDEAIQCGYECADSRIEEIKERIANVPARAR